MAGRMERARERFQKGLVDNMHLSGGEEVKEIRHQRSLQVLGAANWDGGKGLAHY